MKITHEEVQHFLQMQSKLHEMALDALWHAQKLCTYLESKASDSECRELRTLRENFRRADQARASFRNKATARGGIVAIPEPQPK